MNLSDQVCSLELARKLRELGIKQESEFYHVNVTAVGNIILEQEVPMIVHVSQATGVGEKFISAFTVAELLELFPWYLGENNIHSEVISIEKSNEYSADFEYMVNLRSYQEECFDKNLANACAMMLIYLIENKLMEIK